MRQTFVVIAGLALVAMSATDAEAGRRFRGRAGGGCYSQPACNTGCGHARPVRQRQFRQRGNGCGNVCSTGCAAPAPVYSTGCNSCGIASAPVYSAPVVSTGCNSCGVTAAPVSYSQPMVSSGCNSCGVTAAPVSYSQPMVSSGCNSCGMTYTSAPMTTGCGGMIMSGQVMGGTIVSGGCGTAGGCGTGIVESAPMTSTIVAPATDAPAPATTDAPTIEDAPAPPAAGGVEDAPAPPAEDDKSA
ncbi:MAG: hypothetical protein AB8G99_05135 [Planctomycetaceae bacterium]